MALISTIRKNSWLLIVSLGLALGAFIIMDISGSQNMGGGNQFEMGSVDGKEIDYRDFQRTEQVLYSGGEADIYSKRDFLWNYFVEKHLVEEEAEKLGLAVGRDELLDLQFGNNISPVVAQRFMNPQTGGVDRAELNNMKQMIESGQMPENARQFWAYQEKEIIKYRLEDKLLNLAVKGMYIPRWMVNQEYEWEGNTASFAYVNIPFDEVSDSDVSVSDSDIMDYMNKHKDLYYNDEETRIGEYLKFQIKPTSQDTTNLLNQINQKKDELLVAENDSIYAVINDGFYVNIYATRAELPADIPDEVFETEVGEVYGPYINNSHYEIAKVVDEMIVPDSVHARHIMRMASPQQPQAVAEAKALLDSLKTELENGRAIFDSLAVQYSQDQSAGDGGDLGTFTRQMMIPEISSAVFYKGEKGKYQVVQTNQGMHLIQVVDQMFETDSKGVKLAIVRIPIIPSEDTQNEVYDYAADLASENRTLDELREAVSEIGGVRMYTTPPMKKNDYIIEEIGDNDVGRSIVQWMYERGVKVGNVSEIFVKGHPELYYNEDLYIVGLKEILKEGLPPVEAVRSQITPLIIKEKKGEILSEKIASLDLAGAASQYSTDVDTLNSVKLSSTSAPGIGQEPIVISSVFALDQGQTSKPVIGNNGVYLLHLISKESGTASGDLASSRNRIKSQMVSSAGPELMESLKGKAKIKDNRANFF